MDKQASESSLDVRLSNIFKQFLQNPHYSSTLSFYYFSMYYTISTKEGINSI